MYQSENLEMSDLDKFWNLIETKLGCNVPKHIQNILALNGYENAVSIKTLKSVDIQNLEKFVKEGMKSRIPKDAELSEYYGCFASSPVDFVFLPGYRKLLEEIVDFINAKTSSDGPEFFAFKTNIDRNKQLSRAKYRAPNRGN